MLILLSGPSGSGKNTIIKGIKKILPNIKYLQNQTTRMPRENELEMGELCPYHFISEPEFLQKVHKGEFYEYEKVHISYYGTLNESINEIVKNDKHWIKDIDVFGNLNLKKCFAGKIKVFSIFLSVPDNVLKQRLQQRGESEESINVRLSRAEMENSHKKEYDLVINNIDFENTIKIIKEKLCELFKKYPTKQ